MIICTDGFHIFRDKEKMKIIRHYAEKTGIIILTDSDSAGFKIRNYIKGAVGTENIVNVYIPDIFGKERRKASPSAEGKLGVEGMDEKTLREAFEKAGVISSDVSAKDKIGRIDKGVLYELGYSGMKDSSARRSTLLRHLDLPELMTANALADILNTIMDVEELERLTEELFGA